MAVLRDLRFYGAAAGGEGSNVYYSGATVSELVPHTYPISLNGRPYIVDFSQPFYREYHRQLATLIRTQADTSKLPSEQSLDPNGLWRRSFEDWSLGAGQRYLDRAESIDNRFWVSKGLDVLTTKWQISLLPDTVQSLSSTSTNLALVEANGYLYAADGQALKFYDGTTWTTVTGTPPSAISSLCTDGATVYAAVGANGIYSTTAGSSSANQYVSSAVGADAVVGYANGRLMVGDGDALYNVTASGALPAALLTAGNSSFVWSAIAETPAGIVAAGTAGSRSFLYSTAVTADGTALSAPVIQGRLPAGETVSSLTGYLGALIIGTSRGVRFATVDTSGSITLGSLIPTGSPVECAVGWDRFVYFGWTDYDTASTGIGRMDLENFVVADIQPAYASDLMVTGQGAVTGVAVYSGNIYLAVSGLGVYVQDNSNLVASGTIDSGYVLYDLIDQKIATLLDVQTEGPLAYGSYETYLSVDAGAFQAVGKHTVGQSEPVTFWVGGLSGQRFEMRLVVSRDGTSTDKGPTVTRWTLRSYPAPKRPLTWQLPIILDEEIVSSSGTSYGFDPFVELRALEELATDGELVLFQEGEQAYPVFVQDVEFVPNYTTESKGFFNGLAMVTLTGLPVTP